MRVSDSPRGCGYTSAGPPLLQRSSNAACSSASVIHRLLSNLGGLFSARRVAVLKQRFPTTAAPAVNIKRTRLALVSADTMVDTLEHALSRSPRTLVGAAGRCYSRCRRRSMSSNAPAAGASTAGGRPFDQRERADGPRAPPQKRPGVS
jgi:hypothetical protein